MNLDVGVAADTPYTSKYTNITVCGDVYVNGYAYVGGVFGKNAYANLTDITVEVNEGSYVKARSYGYRTHVGGVAQYKGKWERHNCNLYRLLLHRQAVHGAERR